jgi:hypothetical protein
LRPFAACLHGLKLCWQRRWERKKSTDLCRLGRLGEFCRGDYLYDTQ